MWTTPAKLVEFNLAEIRLRGEGCFNQICAVTAIMARK